MKRTQAALAAALVFALAFPVTSCTKADYASEGMMEEKPTSNSAEAIAYPTDESFVDTEEYGFSGSTSQYSIAENGEPEEASIGSDSAITTSSTPSAQETQKLIYTASLTLDTTDFKKSVDALHELMARCEAFAEYEDEWTYGSQDLHVLSLTLRVPAERYDELMKGAEEIEGTCTNRTSQVTNITRQYADNETVIEGLEIQEERLLEMMEEAETIEDMILVEERLSDVQLELNLARSKRENMDTNVSLSTVTVTINEVRHATTTAQTSYGTRVGNAFVDMWDNFVEGLGDFGIALIYAIPAIVIVVAIVLAIFFGVRKHTKKKAAQPAKLAEPLPLEETADTE